MKGEVLSRYEECQLRNRLIELMDHTDALRKGQIELRERLHTEIDDAKRLSIWFSEERTKVRWWRAACLTSVVLNLVMLIALCL